MEKKFINPPTLSTPRGYSQIVTVQGGKTIFIAGQVATDAKGEVVGKGDLGIQAKQAYGNLKTALEAAGAKPSDVVKMNTYIVNLKSQDLYAIRDARAGIYPQENPPASTLVGVTALAREDFLIEVEAVAVVD